ncbi:MAG: helical backbone metal receptor [Deltaproteobacteria bacterium]|jgi:iron complex transport system substrate-binding protein|nr:helical backbone metal receptor [Deltaproteobacteria bacterium]
MDQRLQNVVLTIIFIVGLAGAVMGRQTLSAMTAPPPIPDNPRRIVSLAPSITETLFALGLGGRVIGVTEYCRHPPEVQALPRVAGFSDVNFEAVLRSRPDLTVLPVDKLANARELERLGLTVLPLDVRSLTGYLQAVGELGEVMSRQAEAAAIIGRLEAAVEAARNRAGGRRRPRTLFSVMHSYQGFGYITEITAVGQDGFFSQLLDFAGGENVYQGPLSFPSLTREAILTLNPEVVVDLVRNEEEARQALEDWRGLGGLAAVKAGRLHMFADEADTVPGPRIGQTLAKLSLVCHPETPALAPGGPDDAARTAPAASSRP